MRLKRLCFSALAFLLIAAMSITAFAADYEVPTIGSNLRDALQNATSGDTVSLTDSMDLHAADVPGGTTTLPAGVTLKSSNASEKTLTVTEGATFQIHVGARVSKLVNLKTSGSGKYAIITSSQDQKLFEEIRYGGSNQLTTLHDNVHYFDTSAEKVSITIKVGEDFVNGIGTGTGDYPFTLYLVDEADHVDAHDDYSVQLAGGERKSGTIRFNDVPGKNKTYRVMIRLGGNDSERIDTGYVLRGFNGATASAALQSINWDKLVAGHAYKAFTITNPDNYTKEPHVNSTNLSLNEDGMLIAKRPMAKTNVDVRFLFRLPNGLTRGSSATKAIEIKSPVTAPSSVSVRTNQRTKVFAIDMPKFGESEYAGYELTDIHADNPNVIFNLENGAEYITVTKNLNANVTFSFTFKDAAERNEAGTGDKFTVEHMVKVVSTTPNPPHVVSVTAPKLYISVGESVQLSVPGEKISNASSNNLSVAFATGGGKVIGIAPGTATIYVNTEQNGQGTIQIMVVGASVPVYAGSTTLAEDDTTQIYFGNGTPIIYAYSNNTRVIRVTESGRVTAVSPGTATVYVTGANGTGGTITFTVTKKALKIGGTSKIPVGGMGHITLPAGESILNVTSSNPSVVSVNGSGYYTGLKSGKAILTVTSITGRIGTFEVTVTGGTNQTDSRTIKVGGTTQLTVQGDSILTAYSENTKIATVTSKGKVTGVAPGTTVIHVYTKSGSYGTVTITVTGTTTSSSTKTLLVDQSLTLKISGKRIKAATLEEDNGTISVNNSGKVTALAEGTDTVLLITSDNKVHRVKIVVKARSGKISIKKNAKLALKSRPGSGSTLTYLKNGNKVTILARSGNYYKVQVTVGSKKYTGYVARSSVKK